MSIKVIPLLALSAFLLFLPSEIVLAETNDNKSIFSIFDTEEKFDQEESKNKWINPDADGVINSVLIPKASSDHEEYDFGILKIVDVSFGRHTIIKSRVNESFQFSDLDIELKRCVKESRVSLSQNYKAFIKITEKNTGLQIFNGWIFSSYRSISQPVYSNYFFFLDQCAVRNLKNEQISEAD